MTEYTVTDEESGIRLDRWFKRHLPQVPHGLLERLLRKGDVRVAGKKAKTSDRLEEGQIIEVRQQSIEKVKDREQEPRHARSTANALSVEAIRMMQEAVLFKNGEAIVLDKPPGLAVQGGTKITTSVDGLLDALRFEAPERPRLVHRLDKDTSGVLVIARSAKSATKLTEHFAGKTAEKTYWALVKGAPPQNAGKIDLALAKQEEGDLEKVAVDEEEGKRAVTHYRVIERLSRALAWVELIPVTGRTHQLRVHMASIGHPIVGDGKYGAQRAMLEGFSNKLHLHARRIVIPGLLDVSAPLPRHMQETWRKLGLEE